jgi:tetratricopeptide (TPR) repeat protein
MNKILAVTLNILLLMTPGCGTHYLQARKTDLMQSFHVGVCMSKTPGVSANVSASFVGANLGYFEGSCVGNNYGYAAWWQHYEAGFGVGGRIHQAELGRDFSVRSMADFGYDMEGDEYLFLEDFFMLGFHANSARDLLENPLGTKFEKPRTRWGAVDAGLHSSLLGISMGFDFMEFLDFVTGWIGVDIRQDDDLYLPLALSERVGELPLYGGFDRQSFPELKAKDEQFIVDTEKRYGSREKGSEAFVERGVQYYFEGNSVMAMKQFNQAWLLSPNNPDVFWGFATVLHGKAKYCEAKAQIDRALSLNLSNPIALADAGLLYAVCAARAPYRVSDDEKREAFSASTDLFNKAIAGDPSNGAIFEKWARALYYMGHYREAWEKIDRQRSTGGIPDSALINLLGLQLAEPKTRE